MAEKVLLPYAGITRFRFKGSTFVLSAGRSPAPQIV